MKSVEHNERAHFMRLFDNCFSIVNKCATKNDVRDWHEQPLFVDGIEQALCGYRDAVVRLDHVQADAAPFLSLPEVHYGREIHVGVDDSSGIARDGEARGDDGLTGSDVLMSGDGTFGSVHQGANFVTDMAGKHPPALFPGANAARGPGFSVVMHGVVDTAGHGTEGIADQVRGAVENGELGTMAEQIVGHWNIVSDR